VTAPPVTDPLPVTRNVTFLGAGKNCVNPNSQAALLVSVQLDVTLCCFTSVMRRVQMMTVRGMRMVSRRLVFAGAMMFSCFVMMLRRVFMVFGSLRVMFL
jgi:hypothetical protein